MASIDDSSSAVTVMPAALPARVVRLLPLRTFAWVLLRILLTPTEPAPATAKAEPVGALAMPPAAPMPSEKMLASMSASTLMAPPAVTSESSTTAQTLFSPSTPSLPSELTAKAAPKAPAATASAPAPAMISASLLALTVTASATFTVLVRSVAVVSASISLIEPEAAPARAMAEPFCAIATANAPATVKDLMAPVELASIVKPPRALPAQMNSLASTRASVSVWMSLKARATPAATAVAEFEPPLLAMAMASAPEMVKISASSVARTRALLVTSFQFAEAAKAAAFAGSRVVITTADQSDVSA